MHKAKRQVAHPFSKKGHGYRSGEWSSQTGVSQIVEPTHQYEEEPHYHAAQEHYEKLQYEEPTQEEEGEAEAEPKQ